MLAACKNPSFKKIIHVDSHTHWGGWSGWKAIGGSLWSSPSVRFLQSSLKFFPRSLRVPGEPFLNQSLAILPRLIVITYYVNIRRFQPEKDSQLLPVADLSNCIHHIGYCQFLFWLSGEYIQIKLMVMKDIKPYLNIEIASSLRVQ